jgi:hypothetical protein
VSQILLNLLKRIYVPLMSFGRLTFLCIAACQSPAMIVHILIDRLAGSIIVARVKNMNLANWAQRSEEAIFLSVVTVSSDGVDQTIRAATAAVTTAVSSYCS